MPEMDNIPAAGYSARLLPYNPVQDPFGFRIDKPPTSHLTIDDILRSKWH